MYVCIYVCIHCYYYHYYCYYCYYYDCFVEVAPVNLFQDSATSSSLNPSSSSSSPEDHTASVSVPCYRRSQRRGRGRGCGTGRGRARGRGGGRGRGRGRGRGCDRGRGTSAVPGTPNTANSSGEGCLDSLSGVWNRVEPVRTVFDYSLTPGPTSSEVTSGANLKAVDLFNRFFTDDVWDLLVEETNRFAAFNIGTSPHARPWKEVSKDKMKAFIGLLLTMGILRLPRLEKYWENKCCRTRTPGVSEVMPRVRFEQIFQFFSPK